MSSSVNSDVTCCLDTTTFAKKPSNVGWELGIVVSGVSDGAIVGIWVGKLVINASKNKICFF